MCHCFNKLGIRKVWICIIYVYNMLANDKWVTENLGLCKHIFYSWGYDLCKRKRVSLGSLNLRRLQKQQKIICKSSNYVSIL